MQGEVLSDISECGSHRGAVAPTKRARRALRSRDESGLGLIDVVIGVFIFLLVLAPLLYLLARNNTSSSGDRFRVTALSLASSYVDEIQALQSTAPPSPPTGSVGSAQVNTTYKRYLNISPLGSNATTWPAGPATGSWQKDSVGSVTYTIEAVGGWCNESKTTGKWGQGTSTNLPAYKPSTTTTPPSPTAYWVSVKVQWGSQSGSPTQRGAGSIIQNVELTSQTGWPYTATGSKLLGGKNPTECPLVAP